MDDITEALFELLEPIKVEPAAVKEPRLGAIGVKWTAYRGVHKPCDLCVQVIHEKGAAHAPVPRPARQKRVGPNDTLFLCDIDAMDQRRKDGEAEKVHKERVALHGGTGARPVAKRKAREGMA